MRQVMVALAAILTVSDAKFQFTAGLGPEWNCAVC